MKTESLLLLERYSFRRETNALFDLLASSPMARENFFNNPAGVMRAMFTFMHDKFETAHDDIAANRLLFSIVSHPKFFEFLDNHEGNQRGAGLFESLPDVESGQAADKAEILNEFTKAFAQWDDEDILEGLLTSDRALCESMDQSPGLVLVLLFVVGLITVVAGPADRQAFESGLNVSAAEMRSLASALAMQAILPQTSETPFVVASSQVASVPATPWMIAGTGFAQIAGSQCN